MWVINDDEVVLKLKGREIRMSVSEALDVLSHAPKIAGPWKQFGVGEGAVRKASSGRAATIVDRLGGKYWVELADGRVLSSDSLRLAMESADAELRALGWMLV